MSIERPYKAGHDHESRPYVSGPGMSYYGGWTGDRFTSEHDAKVAADVANEAYKLGFLAAQDAMKKALGLTS